MKKQVFFSLGLTASAVLFVTGCATKQSASAAAAEREAIEIANQEEQLIQDDINAETVTPLDAPEQTVTPAEAEPAPAVAPAQTTEPAPAPAPATLNKGTIPQPVEYTVTAGDSISALSARFDVRKADILALNPSLRNNPNSLRIGQKVKFPAGTKVTTPAKIRAKKTTPKGANTYTVKAGDVLGGIANRHGVTVAALREANAIKGDHIWVGQKLIIPAGGKTVAKKAPAKAPAKKVEKKAEPKKEAPKKEEAPKAEPALEAPAPVVEEAPAVIEIEPPAVDEAPALDATVPPAPAVEAPAPVETRAYVVAPGEDLVSVSLKWGVPLPTLRAINNLDEAQGNAIAAGTTLQIPVVQE